MHLNLSTMSTINGVVTRQKTIQPKNNPPRFRGENLNYIHETAYRQLDTLLTKATTNATQQLQKTFNDRFDELIKLLTPVNPPYKNIEDKEI